MTNISTEDFMNVKLFKPHNKLLPLSNQLKTIHAIRCWESVQLERAVPYDHPNVSK